MTRAFSLRMRLTLVILIPLTCVAFLVGVWAVADGQNRAADQFDRSLLSTSLAISRDVTLSGGDALSRRTRDLLRDTSGGQVYYHVYAPDGVFVTGYATPPVPDERGVAGAADAGDGLQYFDARYQGRPVRALRLIDVMESGGLSGEFTFTVWQDVALRNAFVRSLSWRTFRVIAALFVALTLIVWFGVRIGLRPLLDLQGAIAQRSAGELTPIRRAVPVEAQGIVQTLNALLGQVASSMRAKDDFISDAAHQLRNPIAGVLAMSEAIHNAPSAEAMQARSGDLLAAAQRARDLADKLLTHERAKGLNAASRFETVDLGALLRAVETDQAEVCAAAGVVLSVAVEAEHEISGDAVLLREALVNLIDNALAHAGASRIELALTAEGNLAVSDDGKGIPEADRALAMERFGQVHPSDGSGLGLAIARAVAQAHGGRLVLRQANGGGLRVEMQIGGSR